MNEWNAKRLSSMKTIKIIAHINQIVKPRKGDMINIFLTYSLEYLDNLSLFDSVFGIITGSAQLGQYLAFGGKSVPQ